MNYNKLVIIQKRGFGLYKTSIKLHMEVRSNLVMNAE